MSSPVVMAWSGGKDSSLALSALLSEGRPVAGLLTTVTADYDRISMHGVRRSLLKRQAESLRLPLTTVEVSAGGSSEEYGRRMKAALQTFQSAGVDTVAFGDLFLGDVRAYREAMLAQVGMCAIFPLWGSDTGELARRFVRERYRAVLVCVDSGALDPSFCGRDYDDALLAALPGSVDPCGENGEFHTFVHDGPIFTTSIPFRRGETVMREERFYYHDLE